MRSIEDMRKYNIYKDGESADDIDSQPVDFMVLESELRKEAVEDINALRNLKKTYHGSSIYEHLTGNQEEYSTEAINGVINYVKWKNNISEEDLQGDEE